MSLDKVARKNLELTASLSDGQRKGTLLSVIDKTETAMGGRTLRQWLEQPLMSVEHISRRLDAVDELARDLFLREGLAESMKGIQDLERICGRIVMRTATPRDLVSLKWSLSKLGGVKDNLSRCESGLLTELCDRIDLLEDLVGLISQAIVDDPPASLREGGVIREGYSSELDELRELRDSGKRWIAQLEQTERARTGIKSLRVGYNQVFGYYIEVTRANLNLVPDDYIRKQTLANAERFITPSLKEREERILSAEERSLDSRSRCSANCSTRHQRVPIGSRAQPRPLAAWTQSSPSPESRSKGTTAGRKSTRVSVCMSSAPATRLWKPWG